MTYPTYDPCFQSSFNTVCDMDSSGDQMVRSIRTDPSTQSLVVTDINNYDHFLQIGAMMHPELPTFETFMDSDAVRVNMSFAGTVTTLAEYLPIPHLSGRGSWVKHVYLDILYRDLGPMDMLKLLAQHYGKHDHFPVNNLLSPVEDLPQEIHFLSERLVETRRDLTVFDETHLDQYTPWIPYCNKMGELF